LKLKDFKKIPNDATKNGKCNVEYFCKSTHSIVRKRIGYCS
jgi:hypothetical protein